MLPAPLRFLLFPVLPTRPDEPPAPVVVVAEGTPAEVNARYDALAPYRGLADALGGNHAGVEL